MSEELVKRLRARAKRENDYYEHGGDICNRMTTIEKKLYELIKMGEEYKK